MRIPLWSRLRLAPRIAIVVLGSLLAVEVADEAMPMVIHPPPMMFFQQDWLIDNLRDIRERALQAPDTLHDAPARHWLDANLVQARPSFHGEMRFADLASDYRDTLRLEAFANLRAVIAAALGLPVEDVLLQTGEVDDPARSVRPLVVVLPTLPAVMWDMANDRNSNMLSSDLRVAFPLGTDRWLVVAPRSDGREAVRAVRNVILPLGAVLMIALLSVLAARGVVRPLDDLAAAAEKLGRDRELRLVGDYNAPELQAIGQSFNRMQQRLKRFVDDRLQMIAAISHDLRTPLTRLRLFAEYVGDPDQRRQILTDVGEMEAMVGATLTFASSQLADEARGAIDLAAMLISLCDTAADAGAAVGYDGPDHAGLTGQPVAIRRAFANLIENGCKFGTLVDVRLRVAHDQVVVTVADNGPGIPAEQRDRVLQPFVRLEASRNRDSGGTGLGLTIAHDAILAQKGSLVLDDAPGGGLLVKVTLPNASRA